MNGKLDLYRDQIAQLMQSRSGKLVSNGLPDHAAALYELFFKNAENSMRILCNNLASEVFGRKEVINAAVDALKRGVSIRIIAVGHPGPSNPFLQAINDARVSGNNFEMQSDAIKSGVFSKVQTNFAVMDKRAYRFEEDYTTCKAVACMQNEDLGAQLAKLFDVAWNSVKPTVAA